MGLYGDDGKENGSMLRSLHSASLRRRTVRSCVPTSQAVLTCLDALLLTGGLVGNKGI